MNPKQAPLLVIVGETASGKSALALQLAQRFDGELICADSSTVRREASIGAAKPSIEEQALVPHHVLDVVGPDEPFSAAAFQQLAVQAIEEISARGKLPIMVGGTGLYIDGVIFNYSFLQSTDEAERARLNALSIDALLAEAGHRDIDVSGIDTRNPRRIQRLLETGGATPERQPLRDNTYVIGLQCEREVLRDRVTRRVDAMLTAGLESEVATMADRYGWECEALKGVGYAQWREYFLGHESISETRAKIIKATLDLAKRQRTWFKRNKSIHWLSAPVNLDDIADSVTTNLYK